MLPHPQARPCCYGRNHEGANGQDSDHVRPDTGLQSQPVRRQFHAFAFPPHRLRQVRHRRPQGPRTSHPHRSAHLPRLQHRREGAQRVNVCKRNSFAHELSRASLRAGTSRCRCGCNASSVCTIYVKGSDPCDTACSRTGGRSSSRVLSSGPAKEPASLSLPCLCRCRRTSTSTLALAYPYSSGCACLASEGRKLAGSSATFTSSTATVTRSTPTIA